MDWSDRDAVRRFYFQRRNELREMSPIHVYEPTVFAEREEQRDLRQRRVPSPHIPVTSRMLTERRVPYYLSMDGTDFSYVYLIVEVVEGLTRKNGYYDFTVKDADKEGPVALVCLKESEQVDRYPSSESPDSLIQRGNLLRIHGVCDMDRGTKEKKLDVMFMRRVEEYSQVIMHKLEVAYAKKYYIDKQRREDTSTTTPPDDIDISD